ncbi:MAG: AEC family transporter [Halobacteria archaeon]|nr:AEC family transporter [Halobacteria archaeon]
MVIVETLVQMIALVGLGALWRYAKPGRTAVQTLRSAITDLVFYLLLPALVLRVLWQADVGVQSIHISAIATSSILAAMLFSWLACKSCRTENRITGAAILAASFANITYLGLPVITSALGEWAASIAIQYDLFSSTPLLFTLGMLLAAYFGQGEDDIHPLRQLARIPALWAALLAVILNLATVPMPTILEPVLRQLGNGVVPLMLIAIGLSLEWRGLQRKAWGPLVMVIAVQLILMPLFVWGISGFFDFSHEQQLALVLEAAMPSMVIGLMICERYNLDTAFYAAAVTLSTILSIVTLPYWFIMLS